MGNYIARPRDDHAVSPGSPFVLDTLRPEHAFWLPANNVEARIAFAEIAVEHVLAHEGIQIGPVCFVTITPAVCALPVGDVGPVTREVKAFRRTIGPAARFNVRELQQIARQGMGDVPFIGIIEAALYHRWSPAGRCWGDWISWHCHLLAWGAHQWELTAALAPLRARHRSMREGLASVHVQAVPEDDVARQFLYALKAPQKLYRVEYFKRPWRNPSTGEVKQPGWHTQKDWLRTGQRIRLLDIIGERLLNNLLFGNREGTDLAHAICNEALGPFHAWERQQSYAQRR
ncbi:hypothetical protein [Methylobacterium sp. Leaf94]|uniref:hypothetical protein n=1 Tax=Methylobacterium sp. Leaf94 TaxID=1736250 RepID=UPI0012E3B4A2|nr:hypothetical protein [Methylobacterium sp. Leaf94]